MTEYIPSVFTYCLSDSICTVRVYFRYFKMGYASALAWILFLIILVLTLIQLKLSPRWVHYENEG
jgi:ABC-type sugar transport system permease subunit